jgi:HD-GYP domain-containing protein (c-di-GMP phosphodiesterase class II)
MPPALKTEAFSPLEKLSMPDGKYMAFSPGVIIPGALPKFKIFFLSEKGDYILWALEGNKVTIQQLAKIAERGLKEVFVDLDEQFEYEEYLETNLGKILENPTSSVDQKVDIFSKVSTNVVRAAFETSFGSGALGPVSLKRIEKMVQNALLFLTETKSLQALAQMIGHDYQTYQHATKVFWFLVAFLRDNPDILELIEPDYQDLTENQKMDLVRQCGVAGLLHDVGKVFISPEILNKNGPLTEIEWEVMKRHPLSSLAMFLGTDLPEFVKKAALQHHEDFNGRGYPLGLNGPQISILARVLRIIDSFDAMTSSRPYKDALSAKKAIEIMIGIPAPQKGDDGPEQVDRDQGMMDCFDEDLLRNFIIFLGKMNLNE